MERPDVCLSSCVAQLTFNPRLHLPSRTIGEGDSESPVWFDAGFDHSAETGGHDSRLASPRRRQNEKRPIGRVNDLTLFWVGESPGLIYSHDHYFPTAADVVLAGYLTPYATSEETSCLAGNCNLTSRRILLEWDCRSETEAVVPMAAVNAGGFVP
jgi:hypothetical protein